MPNPAPDWFPDPFGRFELRYWDGVKWTEHVARSGQQQIDPPVVTPPRPEPQAGWHPDPTRRHELRYWDGRWTEHVTTGGRPALDPVEDAPVAAGTPSSPATEAPAGPDRASGQPPARPSKKVEKQVRRAGAATGVTGGGTLLTENVLVVNQKAKLIGSTLAYDVFDQNGQQLGSFQEVRRDLATKMGDKMRGRTDSNRSFRFQVVDVHGRVLLALSRPEQWFTATSSISIEGPDGIAMGHITRETTSLRDAFTSLALDDRSRRLASATDGAKKLGHVRFGLEAGGRRLGSLYATNRNAWEFAILDESGVDVGKVTKTWAGWTKERFTKADNYVVQMKESIEDPLRSLVVAAALAIDVALKQGPQTSRSSWSGTRRYS